jgi:hypothetical protein
MKNIALKFTCFKNPTKQSKLLFQSSIKEQIEQLSEVEAVMILKKQQTRRGTGRVPMSKVTATVPIEQGMIPLSEEISISYLIIQHKKEMLDQNFPLQTVVKETLDAEFVKMLHGCLFVPFLHEDTPQKCVIPMDKEPSDKHAFVANWEEANFVLSVRQKAL